MPSVEQNWAEKRDFIRMRLNSEVTLHLEQPPRTLTGRCRDLSGAGLSVELDEALPTGTRLTATFASIDGSRLDDAAIQTRAEVARVERTAHGHFLHGCLMLEILA